MKYHCTRRKIEDLSLDDRFYGIIKVVNLGEWDTGRRTKTQFNTDDFNQTILALSLFWTGIPTLMYGIAAIFLIRYTEYITIKGYDTELPIYFLYKEDKGAQF